MNEPNGDSISRHVDIQPANDTDQLTEAIHHTIYEYDDNRIHTTLQMSV